MAGISLGCFGPWFFRRDFILKPHDAGTHMHVIGVSGSGKSRFLASLYLQLLDANLAATLIDPHGDLARLILGHLVASGRYADERTYRKILYLDFPGAERAGRYLPFNVLKMHGSPYTIANNVLDAFHRAWPSLAAGNAPMFDTLVQNGVKALISADLPLTVLTRFLTDKLYRDAVLEKESDPDIVSVFHDWFDKLSAKDQLDQAGSTVRRVNLISFDPVLKYSLGQPENALDFRHILDNQQSLIVNLALQNADAKRLLGCLLTVFAEQGALSRADLPPEKRFGTHHLVIDEFSEFTAQGEEALTTMLSQTRKFGLFLVMSHQTWSQASERLRGAMQNVGLEAVFRLGREDSEYTAKIIGGVDPTIIKHEVPDENAQERTHPVFSSNPEQWESWTAALQELYPRGAFIALHHVKPWPRPLRWFIKRGPKLVRRVRTPAMPDAKVDSDELARIENEYLKRYFKPRETPIFTRAPNPLAPVRKKAL